ncbi:MAG: phospho-N-acetylmuramoyl-pentapeptide-transferase, partial [Planctomycetes bacterium]|nr:phospho-N-acetylmuramoyl-pentapeptide-transferase [Planctomycetota bacterium]
LFYLGKWWYEGKHGYAYEDPLFRGTIGVVFGFLIVWALGPLVIRNLIRLKLGVHAEFDHEQLNKLTQGKKKTPTMGGALIVASITASTLLLADLGSFYVRMGLFCLVWLALLGGIDDWLKLTADRRVGTRDGLRSWEKLVFQVGLGALLAIFILREGATMAETVRFDVVEATYKPMYNLLILPFVKAEVALPTWIFVIITVLVIAGTSNAVNLTDGMDGLASGCMVLTAFAFMTLAYVVGTERFALPLLFPHIRGAAELSVMCGAAVGACLGFLWYNAYPAQVFMGDTGSLPLGGLMGYVAIVTRMESMLLIVGGVFVLEALSVIVQVSYFKYTGGKRIFRCTPIHHHFHLGGWTETQTVTRFWLLAALFAAAALATIKLR